MFLTLRRSSRGPDRLELLGQAVLPHVRRLDDVVVDGDDLGNHRRHGAQATSGDIAGPDARRWQMPMRPVHERSHLGHHPRLLAIDRHRTTSPAPPISSPRPSTRDGIGAINDALADVCRSLMDRVIFPAGTIDIHAVVDRIALRVVELSHDEQPGSARPAAVAASCSSAAKVSRARRATTSRAGNRPIACTTRSRARSGSSASSPESKARRPPKPSPASTAPRRAVAPEGTFGARVARAERRRAVRRSRAAWIHRAHHVPRRGHVLAAIDLRHASRCCATTRSGHRAAHDCKHFARRRERRDERERVVDDRLRIVGAARRRSRRATSTI